MHLKRYSKLSVERSANRPASSWFASALPLKKFVTSFLELRSPNVRMRADDGGVVGMLLRIQQVGDGFLIVI